MREQSLFDLAVEHNLVPDAYFQEWFEMAGWQFRFLTKTLRISPDTSVLDVGCGALRLGHLLIPYLEDDRYCGMDAFEPYIRLGKDLVARSGTKKTFHAVCSSNFDFEVFDRKFDIAFAQSVLGHLSRQQNERCLCQLKNVMKPGGAFYATVALSGKGKVRPGFFYGGTTPFRKPSFKSLDFLFTIAGDNDIAVEEIESSHQQRMVKFTF